MVTKNAATDYMTVLQAAKVTGKSHMTLYRWIKAGKLKSTNFGGILFIHKDEVERLKKEAGER